MEFSERFAIRVPSRTREACTVVRGDLRISVLEDRLVRVEASKDGKFLDAPTQKVWYRDFDEPKFQVKEEGGTLEIRTAANTFKFRKNGDLVQIVLADGTTVRDVKKGNLQGTARTLDASIGAVKLKPGIMSRNGVTVLDDSKSLILNEDGTISPREASPRDDYYFAYGHDYRGALQAFFRLTGEVPLVPRYCLGNWWSRYKAYTQQEYVELMERFLKEEIPITVATIDMDWHWVDVKKRFAQEGITRSNRKTNNLHDILNNHGWTGYSWNTDLFPDYKAFLRWLQEKNFKVTMNLHPADGVRWFEDMYEDMAKAMGIDPETMQQVEFDFTDPKYIDAYFKYIHHPYEQDGVDFWWIDWQQGHKSKIKGLDPLWALNHYHYLDNKRQGKRPLILSRYADLGSHRYPLGFSGDTMINWPCLNFQPYFTANATNAGYTWWSHDIGGHQFGCRDDELSLRWVQYGVFSPIMRLHSSSNEFLGKEPWKYRWDVRTLMTDSLRLRHRLIPYIYTMNYRTWKDGLALCEPMYYQYPEQEAAYNVPNEYWFGSELLVAPSTQPMDKITNRAKSEAWLPPGRYTDIFNGFIYEGNRMAELYRGIESIPVLAKEGAIIPMDMNGRTNDSGNPKEMEVLVYRGTNTFDLYEDDGESMAFEQGVSALTPLRVAEAGDTVTFAIGPAAGDTGVLPPARTWRVSFRDITDCGSVSVLVNGAEVQAERLAGDTVCIQLEGIAPADQVEIRLTQVCVLQNRPKRDLLVELISGFQLKALYKGKNFTALLDDPSKPVPKKYRGPIQEILDLKQRT
ncbi:MAG: DUF5110 domain-containing protein [Clostridiales bacterium]|nr:DUF5110 domain-containing protein [Clostridiales bacterium]